jgi:hypothetical protein
VNVLARASTEKKAQALAAFYSSPERPATVEHIPTTGRWARYPFAIVAARSAAGASAREPTPPASAVSSST